MSAYKTVVSTGVLFSAFLIGCDSYCSHEEHKMAKVCEVKDTTPSAAFAVNITRISINISSAVMLKITAAPTLANKVVTLQGAAGKSITLGMFDGMGIRERALTPSEVKTLGLGPARLTVEGKSEVIIIRIFVEPLFPAAPGAADLPSRATGGDRVMTMNATPAGPVSLAVFQEQILSMNYYDSTAGTMPKLQALRQYYLTGTVGMQQLDPTPAQRGGSDLTRINDNAPGIAVLAGAFYFAEKNTSQLTTLYQCSAINSCMDQGWEEGTSGKEINFLSNNADASVASAPTYSALVDKQIRVSTDPKLLPTSSFTQSGTNPNSTVTPIQVTLGDVSGDEKPDVAIWYPGGKVSVLLSGATANTLTYDSIYSSKLEQAVSSLISANASIGAVTARDVDGDGLVDFAIAVNSTSPNSSKIALVFSEDNAVFKLGSTVITLPNSLEPVSAIAIGNVKDTVSSLMDLVVGSRNKLRISLIQNQSSISM